MGILNDLLSDTEETVEIKGKQIPIHPLTLQDLGRLLTDYAGTMDKLLGGGGILPHTGPAFIAEVAAMGTGDPVAKQLPAGIQLQLFEAILELSDLGTQELRKYSMSIVYGAEFIRTLNAQVNSAVDQGIQRHLQSSSKTS